MKIKVVLALAAIGAILIWGLLSLPDFGSFEKKDVAGYYLDEGLEETGSANLVNAIVWDFRGYDTLVEEMVLFTAAIAVILVVAGKSKGSKGKIREER